MLSHDPRPPGQIHLPAWPVHQFACHGGRCQTTAGGLLQTARRCVWPIQGIPGGPTSSTLVSIEHPTPISLATLSQSVQINGLGQPPSSRNRRPHPVPPCQRRKQPEP